MSLLVNGELSPPMANKPLAEVKASWTILSQALNGKKHLLKANSSPLKIGWAPKRKVIFQPSIFKGAMLVLGGYCWTLNLLAVGHLLDNLDNFSLHYPHETTTKTLQFELELWTIKIRLEVSNIKKHTFSHDTNSEQSFRCDKSILCELPWTPSLYT